MARQKASKKADKDLPEAGKGSSKGTAKTWTTPEQREWLLARLPAFRESQAKKASGAWFSAIYEDWLTEFPLDPPTEQELRDADGDAEVAADEKKKAKLDVYWWFWNRRGSSNGTTGKRSKGEKKAKTVLDLTKKIKKKVQPYQAYWSLKGKAVTPIVKQAYKDYQKSVPEDQQVEEFAFNTQKVREMYEAETDEVKAEVEAHRRKLVEGSSALMQFTDSLGETKEDLALQQQAHDIQVAINNLPRAIQEVLENIERLTGWKASIFVGGPNPETGMIMSYMFLTN
ncbi:hypothetical protein ONZ51_g6876 [Trametes cubensis]|uniref:Uncharacterized protein n=1 Tax=Trametes cubensis TaxID=1111947 RepID=A0AAD7TTW3_9APHY|nr:hypothetical protein ONZ51_g6876 [Trametes cubensis]